MRYIIAILFAVSVQAETIHTYDSRFQSKPDSRYPVVDVATYSDTVKAYAASGIKLMNFTPPALVNERNVGVTLAGTLEQAEAELAERDVPTLFPNGVETPVTVLTDSEGKGWGVVVDGGDLITYQDHASPRPDKATLQARINAERQARKAIKADLRTVRTNMDALATTNTGANAQAQQIDELRKAVRDLSKALLKSMKDPTP